jgi:cytochrome c biogenesis protein CcmG/thiol:disulfide interchange protein DsbE
VVEDGTRDAPQFVLPDLVDPGGVVRLADHRGTPVVLNFWASWCVPCRKEMPVLARVSDEFARQVAFLGVDHQDIRDDGLALLREAGVHYPSGFDPEGRTAASFGLRGMPTTVFIGANGEVLATSLGELTESELRTSIIDLLGIADD